MRLVWVLLFACSAYSTTASVSPGELQALQDLYTTCNGAFWFNNSNWMMGDPCINNWYGVVCSNSHVVKLVLNSNGMSCSQLPSTIGNLFQLVAMDFSNNEITAPIPSAIQNLRGLQHLDWSYNEMTGVLTAELGSLLQFSLVYLDLSFNDFTGQIPSYFDGASFSFIDLSNNNFICPIPSWAAYTQATCINWTVSYIQSRCIEPFQKWVVYGNNFAKGSNVSCSISIINNFTYSVPAQVISNNELLCPTTYEMFPFQSCSDIDLSLPPSSYWNRGYEAFNLTLSIQNVSILSTPLRVAVLNPYCAGYFDTLSILCQSTNPTPFKCPSSYAKNVQVSHIEGLDYDCVSNQTTLCVSTTPVQWGAWSFVNCPFYGYPSTACQPGCCAFNNGTFCGTGSPGLWWPLSTCQEHNPMEC